MNTEIRRAWQVATWFDKLFLAVWLTAAAVHIVSGSWGLAAFAVVIVLGDIVALQYKAEAAEWKAKFQATRSTPMVNYVTNINSDNVDQALRKEQERRRNGFGYGR